MTDEAKIDRGTGKFGDPYTTSDGSDDPNRASAEARAMSDLDGQEREAREPLSDWLEKRGKQPCIADLRYYEARLRTAEVALAGLKPKIDALGEGFFDGLAQKAGGYDEAALAAREEPQRKSAILGIGTVTNGVAEGWLFDGGDAGLTLLADGTQLAGGWSVEELELISHIVAYAREEQTTTLDMAVGALDRTVPERARKAVERLSSARGDTERPDAKKMREALETIANYDGADWDVEGICGLATDVLRDTEQEHEG